MPAIVDVDPEVYVSASEAFLRVNDAVCDIVGAAATAAGRGGGMAGTDSGGVQWAGSYDVAAVDALRSGAMLVDALGRIGDLLGVSGSNHAGAETASTPGGPPSYPGSAGSGSRAVSILPAAPPSANGTDDHPPHGWFLIAHLLQYTWPNGHQDRLRAVSAGWIGAGERMDDAADRLSGPIADVAGLASPEIEAAVTTCRTLQQAARTVADAYAALGRMCADYAGRLDTAHSQVLTELASLLVETAVVEIIGAVGAAPTAGADEVVAQTLAGARLSVAASRVGKVLGELEAVVRGFAVGVGEIVTRIAEVLPDLEDVLALGASVGAQGVLRAVTSDLPPVDLPASEGPDTGLGHTIDRHVAKDDTYLKGRDIPLASTFPDLATAQAAAALGLATNSAKIDAWLAGNPGGNTLQFSTNIPGLPGRIYDRAANKFIAPSGVFIKLRRVANGYCIITCYPRK